MTSLKGYIGSVLRNARPRLPGTVVLIAVGAVLESIGILAILPVVSLLVDDTPAGTAQMAVRWLSSAGLESRWQQVAALSGGFIVLLALRGWVVFQRDVRLFALGAGYVDHLRSRVFSGIAQARWPFVRTMQRAATEHALMADLTRLSIGTDRILRGGASAATVVALLGVAAILTPLFALTVAVLLGAVGVVTGGLMRRAADRGRDLTRDGKGMHQILGDFLSSQKIARLNNAEIEFAGRFAEATARVRWIQVMHQASQTRARLALQFAAGLVVVACLLAGLFLFETPFAVLVVILVILARLVGPVTALSQAGQSIANALPAYDALCTTLADLECNAVIAAGIPVAGRIETPATVALEGIGFGYPGQGRVLEGLDFTLAPGEVVALAGASGAGKTTLLDIVAGLQEPDCGAVRVDGHALRDDAERRAWRGELAVLPQDPFLFDTSIRENLLWGAQRCDDGDIRAALEVAGLSEFVAGLADGLATRTGERGQNLSGGERQRLCLARALLRKPRALILDEATNALDPKLEEAVFRRLLGMRDRFSVLYVTHRTSALVHADRVVTLSEGRLTSA